MPSALEFLEAEDVDEKQSSALAFLEADDEPLPFVEAPVPVPYLDELRRADEQAAIEQQPFPAATEVVRNTFANFASGAGVGTAQGGAGLVDIIAHLDKRAGISDKIQEATGVDPLALAPAVTQYLRERAAKIPAEQGVNPALANTLPAQFGQGLGSMVPAIASGPAAPVTIAGMMGEQQRLDAEQHGASPEDQEKALYLGAATGALSEALLGVPKLLKLANRTGIPGNIYEKLVRSIAGQTVAAGIREGTQEGAEQLAGNAIANTILAYDPERKTFEGVAQNALLGALVGAPVGGLAGTAFRERTVPVPQRYDTGETEAGGGPVIESRGPEGGIDPLAARAGERADIEQRPIYPEGETVSPEEAGLPEEAILTRELERRIKEREDAIRIKEAARLGTYAGGDEGLGREESGETLGRSDQREEVTSKEDEDAALEQYQQELLSESEAYQEDTGDELLDAIATAGGLPSPGSPNYSEDFAHAVSAARNPQRTERIEYNKLFRRNAPDPDELATRLRDAGFEFEGAEDLNQAVQQRLRTGRKVYGLKTAEGMPFARQGKKHIADYVKKGDLFSGEQEDFKLVGEEATEAKPAEQPSEEEAGGQMPLFSRQGAPIAGPALLTPDGEIIVSGRVGQTHADLMREAMGTPQEDAALEALANDAQHGFVDRSGAVIRSREEAAARAVEHGQAEKGTTRLESENLRESEGPLFKLKAHHGTPHEVDSFRLEKIGTGEGAQAYGWGLYFAEHPEVAEEYRRALSKKTAYSKALIDGKEIPWSENIESEAARAVESPVIGGSIDKAIENLRKSPGTDRHRVADWIEKNRNRITYVDDQYKGNTYTVEIDAEPHELLDWDKSLSEQPDVIRKIQNGSLGRFQSSLTGQQFYETLAERLARNTKEEKPSWTSVTQTLNDRVQNQRGASEYLASLGIKGIRYLDQGSRGAPSMTKALQRGVESWQKRVEKDPSQFNKDQLRYAEQALADRQKIEAQGTHNYVVFDDKHIKITHANGKPLTREERASLLKQKPTAIDQTKAERYTLSDETRAGFTPIESPSAALAVRAIEKRLTSEGRPVRVEVVTPGAIARADKASVAAVHRLARRTGARVVFVRGANGANLGFSGAYYGNKIFLNVDSTTDPLHTTAAHEIWHDIETKNPILAKSIKREIQANAAALAEYRKKALEKGYKEGEVSSEFVGDLFAEAMSDPVLLQRALGANLGRRVLAHIQRWIQNTIKYLSGRPGGKASAAVQNLEAVQARIVAALRQPASASQLAQNRGRQLTSQPTETALAKVSEPAFKRKTTEPPTKLEKGIEKTKEFLRSMMPPGRTGLPVLDYDLKNLAPDFQEWTKAKAVFSQGWGAENIPVLGKLYGGRINARNPITKAIYAWHGERDGVGPALATNIGAQLGGEINGAFKPTKQGDLAVKTTKPGQSTKIGDVFEALRRDPNAYTLTPEQRKAFDRIKPILEQMTALKRKYGLIGQPNEFMGEENQDAYFPRVVTKEPARAGEEATAPPPGSSRVGAKQGFQKERAFRTEAEGWRRGYEYETDIEARLVENARRMYRAIADKRFAADPELGAKTRKQVLNELLDSFEEELIDGRMTVKDVQRIADKRQHRGGVHGQPAFAGKIFDPKVAETLNKAFPQSSGPIINAIVQGNNLSKGIALGFDLGVGQIQGTHLLLSSVLRPQNAAAWAKGQFLGLKAFARPETWNKYAQQNKDTIAVYTQAGGTLGKMADYLAGLSKGGIVERIPGIGHLGAAFGRQFSVFLDTAKIEVFKSWQAVAPQEEWPKVIQAIEATLGGARMESIGLSRARTIGERALLLAPSYYRGAVNEVAGIAESGVSGEIAKVAMAGYMAGGTILFYAFAKALSMADDEILKRLDPRDSNYMKWRVKLPNGNEIEVGLGGVHKSFIRLMGSIAQKAVESPEDFKSLTSKKNPLTSWLRSHSSPVVGATWDALSGEDFLGHPSDITRAYEPLIPMSIRGLVSKQDKVPPTNAEMGMQFFGLNAYGMTTTDQMQRLASQYKRNKGIPPAPRFRQGDGPDWQGLEWALRISDMKAARREHALLSKYIEGRGGVDKKVNARQQIYEHFADKAGRAIRSEKTGKMGKPRAGYLFTGKKEMETEFIASLTPEQKRIYFIAKRETESLPERLKAALAGQ